MFGNVYNVLVNCFIMDDCVFCKIVRGEIPCHKIWEDEKHLGFLDAFPSVEGQVLVIPKRHVAPFVFGMEDEDYLDFMMAVKKVALIVDGALKPVKTGMIVEGLELEHVHAKIFPLSDAGVGVFSGRVEVSDERMAEIAGKIRG